MGQSMQKLTIGNVEKKKAKEIGPIIDNCYDRFFANTAEWNLTNFYHAVSLTVEEINKKIGGTQLRLPSEEVIKKAFKPVLEEQVIINRRYFFWTSRSLSMVPRKTSLNREEHHKGKESEITKEEFGKILRDVVLSSGIVGTGATDILYYIFGVPATALFLKKGLLPNLVPNEIFIPGVTSATVFFLAKFNKI
ncbi:hypothetical protein Sjap_002119 [Stephania japonica]|uniref:Uncharacterized protein n=1 Tax=Stephania japonica TaxID=461633 RepID=A0AAP0KN17_9MAGN